MSKHQAIPFRGRRYEVPYAQNLGSNQIGFQLQNPVAFHLEKLLDDLQYPFLGIEHGSASPVSCISLLSEFSLYPKLRFAFKNRVELLWDFTSKTNK
jgi:hypothetical protein